MHLMSLPNVVTLMRIGLIPLIVAVFYLGGPWAGPLSAAIFGLAGLTDWLDGYLARKMGLTSNFGAFLDPVADKLMVAAILVMVVGAYGSVILTIPAMVIIGREIAISALREWMAEIGQRRKVKVTYIGKVKTTAQIVALLLLLYYKPLFGLPVYELGLAALYIAALLTLWSMVAYLQAAFKA